MVTTKEATLQYNSYRFQPSEGPLTAYGSICIGESYGNEFQFHLRGYDVDGNYTQLEVPFAPALSFPAELPPIHVETWAEWKALLTSTKGHIYYDFDDEISIENFIKMVEDRGPKSTTMWQGQPLSSPYDFMHSDLNRERERQTENPNHNWKDIEGYSFTTLLYPEPKRVKPGQPVVSLRKQAACDHIREVAYAAQGQLRYITFVKETGESSAIQVEADGSLWQVSSAHNVGALDTVLEELPWHDLGCVLDACEALGYPY